MESIEDWVNQQRGLVNKLIEFHIREDISSEYFHQRAAAYTVYPQGHRYRSLVGLEVYQLLGGEKSNFADSLVGLEFIHHASLVFDDLPCMDNSDKRKGKKTTHEEYGEAIAILTGLYLYNKGRRLIFNNTAQHLDKLEDAENLVFDMTEKMLVGQETDLKKEKDDVELLDSMYKKNVLFHLACSLPAYLLNKKEQLFYLDRIGINLCIGYQLLDDLRDVENSQDIIGKPVNVDSKKNTSVYRWGVDATKKRLFEKKEMIMSDLKMMSFSSRLEKIVNYILITQS